MSVTKSQLSIRERVLGVVGLLLIGAIGWIADHLARSREHASRLGGGGTPRVGTSHGR